MSTVTLDQAFAIAVEHHQRGDWSQAETIYRQILGAEPRHAGALHLLGLLAHQFGKRDIAIPLMQEAIAIAPDYGAAYSNFCEVLRVAGRIDEAIETGRAAVRVEKGSATTVTNFGNALKEAGFLEEAIESFRNATNQFDPANQQTFDAMVHSNLVYTLEFGFFRRAEILTEQKRWRQRFEEPVAAQAQGPWTTKDPERPLRVGYVSPDFRIHPIAAFIKPLFAQHDPAQFRVYAYSCVPQPDPMTVELRRLVEPKGVWREAAMLTPDKLAQTIREDEVDILVDLTMHSADNRLPAFARHPAPVQVSWLAYASSAGLRAITYRLTDAHFEPPGEELTGSAEKVVRLPNSWCCYSNMIEPPQPLKARPPERQVTFGSFSQLVKLSLPMIALWSRVLTAVPGSRLRLVAPEGKSRHAFAQKFEDAGVAQDRIEFVSRRPTFPTYLELFEEVDIMLDTQPVNGMTTICDALWMGVPVVTMIGEEPIGRAGYSLLKTMGLPELIARDGDEYVRIAADLALGRPRLAEYHATLRPRLQASPLMDAAGFTRDVEAAFRGMWREWCTQ